MPLFDIDENDETLDDLTESIQLENDNIYIYLIVRKQYSLFLSLFIMGRKQKK
jgi:hypothetical protein